MTHPQIGRALRLMNMEKNGTPTVAEFKALLTDQGRLDACLELLRRPGAGGQIMGYPNLLQALSGTDAGMALALSNASIMAAVAQRPSAMLAFINDQSALDTIFSQPDVRAAFLAGTALAKASVPSMTSATAPSGTASASSAASGYFEYTAFDKNNATHWASANGATTNQWLQYVFPDEVFISTVTVLPYSPPYNPVNCRIERSSDGVSFEAVKTFVMANSVLNTIEITKAGFYRYWRLFVENSGGGNIGVHELNFTGFISP